MKSRPFRLWQGTLSSILLPAALGIFWTGGASAQIVSFNFAGALTGTPYGTGTYLPNDLANGQPISGTITYTGVNVSDNDAPDPNNGVYFFTGAAQGDFSMSVTVTTPMNTYVFSSVAAPAINYNQVQLVLSTTTYHQIDYVAGDPLLNGGPLPATSNGSVMSLGLYDSTRTAFASDSLSTTAPSLANFESAGWNLTGLTTGGVAVYGFNADITSITAVPEPETMAVLAAIGLASLAIWRRTRRTQ